MTDSLMTSHNPPHLSLCVTLAEFRHGVVWDMVSCPCMYQSSILQPCALNCTLHFKKLQKQTWSDWINKQSFQNPAHEESERRRTWEINVNLKNKECINISFAHLNFPCERHPGADNRNKRFYFFCLSLPVSLSLLSPPAIHQHLDPFFFFKSFQSWQHCVITTSAALSHKWEIMRYLWIECMWHLAHTDMPWPPAFRRKFTLTFHKQWGIKYVSQLIVELIYQDGVPSVNLPSRNDILHIDNAVSII